MRNFLFFFCCLCCVCAAMTPVWAKAPDKLSLCPLFGDNAVLQRDRRVPLWGEAAPGQRVVVQFSGQTQAAVADGMGFWRVTLAPMAASGIPHPLTVSAGAARLSRLGVVVGDVWLCAGQSNMQFWVESSDAQHLAASSADPNLRAFLVNVGRAAAPQMQFGQGKPGYVLPIQQQKIDQYGLTWTPATPESVAFYSAVAYTFGRAIRRDVGVPVGLIVASLGGTSAEEWMPRAALQSLAGASPSAPSDAAGPASLYNGSIAPLEPVALRGVIWYQGESNANSLAQAAQYRALLPALIHGWRQAWGDDLPFLIVQLPSFGPAGPEPSDSAWAWVREAQAVTAQRVPKTGLAVTIDTGLAANLHPPTKTIVGERLGQAALRVVYGRRTVPAAPRFQAMTVQGTQAILRFSEVGAGLTTKLVQGNNGDPAYAVSAEPVRGFAICGPDHQFVWANARIIGKDTVAVSSPNIMHPVAVRYAWADFPLCNLYNQAGLPASPFRTDQFPPTAAPARR